MKNKMGLKASFSDRIDQAARRESADLVLRGARRAAFYAALRKV